MYKIVRSDRYDAPLKTELPFNIIGLVAFELFAMHFVETKRGYDLRNPGSQVWRFCTQILQMPDSFQFTNLVMLHSTESKCILIDY